MTRKSHPAPRLDRSVFTLGEERADSSIKDGISALHRTAEVVLRANWVKAKGRSSQMTMQRCRQRIHRPVGISGGLRIDK